MRLVDRPLAFLDLETTGLDYVHYDLIEVAVIRSDDPVPYVSKVRPTLVAPPQAKAIQTNGYNAAEWADAPTWGEVAPELHERIRRCTIVAHNLIGFDLPWLRHYFGCYNTAHGDGITKPLSDLRAPFVDTMSLAHAFLVQFGLRTLSLRACCEFIGLPVEGTHRALGGAQRVRSLHRHITSRIR